MEHTHPPQAVDDTSTEIVSIDASFEPLIPKFMTNRKKEVVVMEEALAAKDLDTVRKVAHGMKGAGGSYGFDRISEMASTIEQAAKAGNASPIARDLPALSSYLDRIKVVYE
jgi:HPt (histidine-containing phosphotransfer) domain-containing protein